MLEVRLTTRKPTNLSSFGIPNSVHQPYLAATINSIAPHDAAHDAYCKAIFQEHYNFYTH